MNTFCSQDTDGALHPGLCLDPLPVLDLTTEGVGIARYKGRVIFLDGGLPGDVVAARVTGIKKGVVQAAIERVVFPSPHTIRPRCPHAGECGGCSWQHFSLAASREWKQKHVRETLARIGKVPNLPVEAMLAPAEDRLFRNKMSFAFFPDSRGAPLLGLRRGKEKSVIEVSECCLQPAKVMRVLAYVRSFVRSMRLAAWAPAQSKGKRVERQGYLRFLVVHTPRYAPKGDEQMLVECITGPAHQRRLGQDAGNMTQADSIRLLGTELRDRFHLTGFVHSERSHTSDLAQGSAPVSMLGAHEYKERFEDLVLSVPYNAFLQTNTEAATLLYQKIAQEAALDGTQIVWDVYSGVGSIALFLAKQAREIHAFEVQADAVDAAKKNSIQAGYGHCRFYAETLTSKHAASLPCPDLVIVDPPRAGIAPALVDFLQRIPAKTLLSISCDTATQARDIARLSSSWRPIKAVPVDMFPYTPHLENLIVLKRK